MANKLFVGGLPYSVTNDQLQDLFAKAGTVVSANVIMDKFSGRSKGFGFVEMATEEEAQNATKMFDGTDLDGRTIHVNEARPQQPRDDNRGFGGGGGHRGGGFNNNRRNDRDRGNRW